MNTITSNIEPKPSTQHRKKAAGGFLKAILAGLLLAVATEGPVLAQTTNAVDAPAMTEAGSLCEPSNP